MSAESVTEKTDRIPGAWVTVGPQSAKNGCIAVRNAVTGRFVGAAKQTSALPPTGCVLKAKSNRAIRNYIREGFVADEVDFTTSLAEIDRNDIPDLIGLSLRTLARRKAQGKRLTMEESDRLYRLQKLISAALRLFEGNIGSMRRWLKTPLPALDGETPLQYSNTEPGAQMVQDIIARAEHGVFS